MFSDDEIVQRSDSIVIGHVDSGFQLISHPANVQRVLEYRYQATLTVTGVMKGKAQIGQIPIVIANGIKPAIIKSGQRSLHEILNPSVADQNTDRNTPVGIIDAAEFEAQPDGDIRKDQIWLLQKPINGTDGTSEINSPQEVQPLYKKDYFEAILSGDPASLGRFITDGPQGNFMERWTRDRLMVQLITKIFDPTEQCDRLINCAEHESLATGLAVDDIFATGSIGAEKLIPVFHVRSSKIDKRFILSGWEKLNYRPAKPVIVNWLKDEDAWWSTKTHEDQIAARDGQKGGPAYEDPRAASYRNIYCSVEALNSFRAVNDNVELIEKIEQRWSSIPDSTNSISNMCAETIRNR